MRWSISNPRVLLIYLTVGGLFGAISWAYLTRPCVNVGFGALGDSILIQSSKLGVNVRSNQFRSEFENILGSAHFSAQLKTADPSIAQVFPENTAVVEKLPTFPAVNSQSDERDLSLKMKRIVSSGLNGKRIVFMSSDVQEHDSAVTYMLFQQYCVDEPSARWVRWFQAWLPGMPDRNALTIQADAANLAVKNVIKKQIKQASEQAASSCRGK
jgi:hypothetical protein